ncbi:hypothetical protein [Paenibacillus soyae]|uniref:Uncharacterized protein n=1 Tax=Paenibacillus soyae TaxID=2969249 RepID=A0A9X2N132_9BACL|nr:hypothetical protein [Paenibacillus soyae]MCR2807147.1 hypothetical protein [Paenibacillus soyae]
MKGTKSMRWLAAAFGAFILVAAIAAVIWYQRADPLDDTGLTVYTNSADMYKAYTVEIVNKSKSAIDILSVTVNDGQTPDYARLGITYDSPHLVQFFEEETDPATQIMELHDATIEPQLPSKDMTAAIMNKDNEKEPTPIHYGIVIRYDKDPIQEVKNRYRYLGFTKVKRVKHWFR